MAIVLGDIKIYESERMTDESDGGGLITGNQVTCGAVNNIFPNISRVDRLEGRTQFRKIFPKITSQNQDTYSGSHIILEEAPTDDNVSITMFDNGTKSDENSDMFTYFEDYYQSDISAGTATLDFTATAGSYSLTFKISDWDFFNSIQYNDEFGFFYNTWEGSVTNYSLNVSTGDVIVIDSEYVQIQKIEHLTQIIFDTQSKRQGVQYVVLYLISPTQSTHTAGATVNTTVVNNAWKCYGTTTLSEAVIAGDIELPVVSEKVRIMPTINLPAEVIGYYPLGKPTIVDDVVVGVSPDTWVIDGVEQPFVAEYKVANPGQSVYVHTTEFMPILDGSVQIKVRYQGEWKIVTDDGAGGLEGWGTGSVDTTDGVISVNLVGIPDDGTHLLIQYQIEIGYKQFTDVPIGTPGALPRTLDFGETNLKEGSVRIQFDDAAARTITIYDNGVGILKYQKRFSLSTDTFNDSYTSHSQRWGSSEASQMRHHRFSWNDTFYTYETYVTGGYDIQQSIDGLNWTTNTNIPTSQFSPLRGQAWDEDNNIHIVFGDDSTTPFECIGYRTGFGGAFTFTTGEGDVTEIRSGIAHRGWFIHDGLDGQWGLRVCDTATFTNFYFIATTAGATYEWGIGLDGNGNDLIIGMNNAGGLWKVSGPDYNLSVNWELGSYSAVGDIVSVVCDTSTETWCAISDECDVLFSEDGGDTWVNRVSNLIASVPAFATTDALGQVITNNSGAFIISNADTVELESLIAYTSDNGVSWGSVTVKTGNRSGEDFSVHGLAMNTNSGILTGFMQAGWGYQFIFNFDDFSDLPEDAGTVDVSAGTGTITAGVAPISTILAKYFLQELSINEFAVSIEAGLPITENTFVATAKKVSDYSDVTISEVGGTLTGDGTGTLDRENGYVLLNFTDAVVPDSIKIGVRGYSIFHPQYDEYDTDRLPTSGLVPGFQVGDVIIVHDGVNEDNAIVTGVSKELITIAVEDGLSNGYAAGTLVSNAVVPGDLVSTEGTYFSESVWPGGWYDTQQGSPANGTWDSVNYPATTTNNGAVTERWAITVTQVTPTLMKVEGEAVGIILTDAQISGAITPANPNAIDPYFSIPSAAWSAEGTHQIGNVYRFNTEGTEVPLWVLRTINAQSSSPVPQQLTKQLLKFVVIYLKGLI
jgi:hypothetical protein